MPMPEPNTYRVKPWSLIAGYIACLLFAALLTWISYIVLDSSTVAATPFWKVITIICSGGVFIGMGMYLVGLHRRRLVVSEAGIRRIGLFGERFMAYESIAGLRTMESSTWLISKGGGEKLLIDQDYNDSGKVLSALHSRYPDVDQVARSADRQQLLSDRTLGTSPAEREGVLERAGKQARAFNWLGGIVGAWVAFYPDPYAYACGFGIIMPLLAVGLSRYSGGLIRLDEVRGSARPQVFTGLFFPVMALFIRSLLDFEIYAYLPLWPLLLVSALALSSVLIWMAPEEGKGAITGVSYFGLAGIYAFGVLIHYNCYYDDRKATAYPVEVLDKSRTGGSDSNYYLYLSAWAEEPERDRVDVGSKLYGRVGIGDTVTVNYRSGKLGIPWYRVVATD